ncbi:hypothetical protein AZH11_10670 [Pseudomonas simiae]|nr:hypothetical protein AZH11_10670 [Pseudomonas simiae]
MAYVTDERLKGYLDTNQLHREQMCLSILALDKRFTNVRPRHPRGGPDGGRDIEAQFRATELAYGAVGFVNQAADIEEKKRTARAKFADDLESAWTAVPRPSVFIFLTNVNFTVGEKSDLVALAKAKGFSFCEILDRERLRVALDSADGFAARFQYLGISMSEAEQASFFAKWGDEIQSVIATGFQEVHSTLSQLLFLQEATQPISGVHVQFKLDREYDASEIGHFRAFCYIWLREPKLDICSLLFGSTDKSDRFRTDIKEKVDESAGIAHGVASGQWKLGWKSLAEIEVSAQTSQEEEDEQFDEYVQIGCSSAVGRKVVERVVVSYSTDSFIRYEPVLSLMDFDESMIMPVLSRSLAEKVERIRIISNGYLLADLDKTDFRIDDVAFAFELDSSFSESELADPWVRIRPSKLASSFSLHFSGNVPARMFKSKNLSSE